MKSSSIEIVKYRNISGEDKEKLMERSENRVEEAVPKVKRIISEIRERKEEALLDYTKKFDDVDLTLDQIRVEDREISQAYESLREDFISPIRKAAEAIERYHKRQLPEEWMEEFEPGIRVGQVLRPLSSVGAYVPGGTAQYPSSVLMSVIPAKAAGVEKVVMCTPPNSKRSVNPATLIAADIAGADEIYKAGGAQAVAMMAYGGEIIPSVDKIVGPGNIYVAAAKKMVSLDVDIDFMAGPSEVLILADSKTDPQTVAIDLVSQAEHDPYAASVLVTTSEDFAMKVDRKAKKIIEQSPRRKTIVESLEKYGRIIIVQDIEVAIDLANKYAPEHLQIMVEDDESVLDGIENAGAIFIGENTPVSAGDLAVGPSHVLPTGGAASRYDGLSVHDFLRMPSVQRLSREGLESLSEVVIKLAEMEGLDAHARSVRERIGDSK